MMRRYWIFAVLTLVFLFGVVGLSGGSGAAAVEPGVGELVVMRPTLTAVPGGDGSDCVELYVEGVLVYAGPGCLPEVTPVPSPTITSTLTAVPSPTVTGLPSPGPTLTAVPTSTPGATPVGGLPLCADHDASSYHGLVSADGSCHYDHEHKHDPNEAGLVALFGPAGEWLGSNGSISYPWETSEENHHKHEAYGWVTRTDIPANGRSVWIRSFRVQGHVDATPFLLPDGTWSGGYLARFHSYSVEAEVCRASDGTCGIVRFAGWLNYGDLEIEGVTQCAPLADVHPNCPHGPGGRRIHFDTPGFPPKRPLKSTFFWYGEPSTYEGSVEALNPVIVAFAMADTWNEVSLETLFDPEAGTFCIDGDCALNGSTIQQHVLQFNVRASFDEDGDGLADFVGFTDRYGRIVEGCTAVALDCIPFVLEHVPVGQVEHRDDRDLGIGPDGSEDFDVSPAALGTGDEWWIAWPNGD